MDKQLTPIAKAIELYNSYGHEMISVKTAIAVLHALKPEERAALEKMYNKGVTFAKVSQDESTIEELQIGDKVFNEIFTQSFD